MKEWLVASIIRVTGQTIRHLARIAGTYRCPPGLDIRLWIISTAGPDRALTANEDALGVGKPFSSAGNGAAADLAPRMESPQRMPGDPQKIGLLGAVDPRCPADLSDNLTAWTMQTRGEDDADDIT